jgi:endonuclease/exonuclease/phosphatase (EEP) superfamily protein YafD
MCPTRVEHHVDMRALAVWLLAAACLGWAVVRLLGLERGYPLVPLVAFTPFVAAGAAAVVLVAVVLRQRAPALLAAVATLVLVAVVAPRALGGPSAPAGATGPHLRVLTVNMHFGTGSADALVALVRRSDADVLSVQELTPELADRLDAAGLDALMPARVLEPQPGGSGAGLYARVPLDPHAVIRRTMNPSPVGSPQVAGAPPIDVVAVHAFPPSRGRVRQWRADLRALPPATPDGRLRILAGDFNATLDHAELRDVLDTGYDDAAAQVGAGLQGTWPRGRRLPPPVTIDHVLADERCGVRAVSVHTIPGTDHRAVLAELTLPRR